VRPPTVVGDDSESPVPAVAQIARVSNRFCGYEGDTRYSTCVSFIAVGALSGAAAVRSFTSYYPDSGLWNHMPSLPNALPPLRAVVAVPSGVLRLAQGHSLDAIVMDCEGDVEGIPAAPATVFTGKLVPRASNDPLAGNRAFRFGHSFVHSFVHSLTDACVTQLCVHS
jgi:hypothetical protein